MRSVPMRSVPMTGVESGCRDPRVGRGPAAATGHLVPLISALGLLSEAGQARRQRGNDC